MTEEKPDNTDTTAPVAPQPNKPLVKGVVNETFKTHNSRMDLQSNGGTIPVKKRSKYELELALTILLVDLAASDMRFDPAEFAVIENSLRRVFGTNVAAVNGLVAQAKQTIINLRGTSQYAELLKEQLNEDQLLQVVEALDDLTNADGEHDAHELFRKNRILKALGKQQQAVSLG